MRRLLVGAWRLPGGSGRPGQPVLDADALLLPQGGSRSSQRVVAGGRLGGGPGAPVEILRAVSGAPALLVWLAGRPRGGRSSPSRAVARRRLSLAFFALNVAWNADHSGSTFHKQFGRDRAPRPLAGGGDSCWNAVALQTRSSLYSPGTSLWVRAPARRREGSTSRPFIRAQPRRSRPISSSHSLHDRVEAHWPAPIYPGSRPSSPRSAAGRLGDSADSRRRCARRAVAGLRLRRGSCWLPVMEPGSRLVVTTPSCRSPPRMADIRGPRLNALRARTGSAWVGTSSYGLAAELADAPGLGATVVQLAERDRWTRSAAARRRSRAAPGWRPIFRDV